MTIKYKHNDFTFNHPKSLIIDRLTLTYSPLDKSDEASILNAIEQKGWLSVWAAQHKKHPYPSKHYKKAVDLRFDDAIFNHENGALLEVKPRNPTGSTSFLRLDYNPNKICYDMICACLNDILPNGADELFNVGNVTRVDLALDIPLVRPQQIILDYKKAEYRNALQISGLLETLYIGKHDSDTQLVMYDKRKEVLSSKLKPKPFSSYQFSDHDLTRLELRHRPHTKTKFLDLCKFDNLLQPIHIIGTPLKILHDKDLAIKRDLCVLKGYTQVLKAYTKSEGKKMAQQLNQIGAPQFLKIDKLWGTLPTALKTVYPHYPLCS